MTATPWRCLRPRRRPKRINLRELQADGAFRASFVAGVLVRTWSYRTGLRLCEPADPTKRAADGAGSGLAIGRRAQAPDHTAATASATLAAWTRPERAEAARCAGSRTLLPIALRASASGLTTTDRSCGPSEASCRSILPLRRSASVT